MISFLLAILHCCHAEQIQMQRRQPNRSSREMRKLRPEYDSLIEKSAVEGGTSMSMRISFDVNASVKSLASGEFCMGAGLHNLMHTLTCVRRVTLFFN
jgi:hypothetical protein